MTPVREGPRNCGKLRCAEVPGARRTSAECWVLGGAGCRSARCGAGAGLPAEPRRRRVPACLVGPQSPSRLRVFAPSRLCLALAAQVARASPPRATPVTSCRVSARSGTRAPDRSRRSGPSNERGRGRPRRWRSTAPPRHARAVRQCPRTVNSAATVSRPSSASSGTVSIIFSWPPKSASSQTQRSATSPAAINTHMAARSARPTNARTDMGRIIASGRQEDGDSLRPREVTPSPRKATADKQGTDAPSLGKESRPRARSSTPPDTRLPNSPSRDVFSTATTVVSAAMT